MVVHAPVTFLLCARVLGSVGGEPVDLSADVYFWSYNMSAHWRRAHSQQPMTPALCQEMEVSAEELGRLETLKQPKLSKRKREER